MVQCTECSGEAAPGKKSRFERKTVLSGDII